MRYKIRLGEVPNYVRERKPFQASGLRGVREPEEVTMGELPTQYRLELADALDGNGVAGVRYIVYSYDTPIMWVLTSGREVMPPVRYSLTTSQHQGWVRSGMHNPPGPAHDWPRAAQLEGRSPFGPREGSGRGW